mmetsp:Transcript_35956/g.91135  ORF Transcript_35956/g.91135 Transcript_35956/m.91135 type:complete len:235 (-) Transcript_35956:96-800(-)
MFYSVRIFFLFFCGKCCSDIHQSLHLSKRERASVFGREGATRLIKVTIMLSVQVRVGKVDIGRVLERLNLRILGLDDALQALDLLHCLAQRFVDRLGGRLGEEAGSDGSIVDGGDALIRAQGLQGHLELQGVIAPVHVRLGVDGVQPLEDGDEMGHEHRRKILQGELPQIVDQQLHLQLDRARLVLGANMPDCFQELAEGVVRAVLRRNLLPGGLDLHDAHRPQPRRPQSSCGG